jgi:L-histidine N-alpha-methyltransferase
MKGAVGVEVLVSAADRIAALERDVADGLTAPVKSLPPVWFYDETGSRLFEEITRLPEYYLTRAERSILERRAEEIVRRSGAEVLVEIGSGTSDKTRILLDAMKGSGQLRQVVLLDISEAVLREAAEVIADAYGVAVRAVVGDLRSHLVVLGKGGRRLWAFLGSTIGNFEPDGRRMLLREIASVMADDDHLLLGTDLVKDEARLVAAYDDVAGVTAAFNQNLLVVLNRELGADFDLDGFEHRARWDAAGQRIEMRLRARSAQKVRVARLGLTVSFEEGEEILTETSAKFRPDQVRAELAAAGLFEVASFQDGGEFQLWLAGRTTGVARAR